MKRILFLLVATTLAACSSSSSTSNGSGGSAGQGGGSAGTGNTNPCGPNGVYGTFQIQGTLGGTETICGLSLGSFTGGTLTIAQGSSGATVTVTGSGAGHIDVSNCAATVNGCSVTASNCAGSTDPQSTVSLDMTVTATTLSGTSQIGFNSCQAPGLSFNGTR